MHACKEIGITRLVEVLIVERNPEWSFCAIRYAPGITHRGREILAMHLTENEFSHARWALETRSDLSDIERRVLLKLTG